MCPRRSYWEYSPFRADYPKTKTVSLVNWIHLNGKKTLSWGQLSMTFREIVIDNKNVSQWQSVSFSLTFNFILNDNWFHSHWLSVSFSLTIDLIVIDFRFDSHWLFVRVRVELKFKEALIGARCGLYRRWRGVDLSAICSRVAVGGDWWMLGRGDVGQME